MYVGFCFTHRNIIIILLSLWFPKTLWLRTKNLKLKPENEPKYHGYRTIEVQNQNLGMALEVIIGLKLKIHKIRTNKAQINLLENINSIALSMQWQRMNNNSITQMISICWHSSSSIISSSLFLTGPPVDNCQSLFFHPVIHFVIPAKYEYVYAHVPHDPILYGRSKGYDLNTLKYPFSITHISRL